VYLHENGIIQSEPFDMAIAIETDYDAINEEEVKEFLEKEPLD